MTKLKILTQEVKHPVIAVTSAIPGEGKTFNAINIASSIALTNKTAVLLDLDLRNSHLAEIFDLPAEKGVVDYIEGNATPEEIICNTKLTRFKVIPAGRVPPNPAKLLSDIKLTVLLEKLRNDFDVVILDTSPVGFVAEIFQLRESIDFNIIVVRHQYTTKAAFKMAIEEIKDHQMKELGIIFNNVSGHNSRYGYKKYGYSNLSKQGVSYSIGKRLIH